MESSLCKEMFSKELVSLSLNIWFHNIPSLYMQYGHELIQKDYIWYGIEQFGYYEKNLDSIICNLNNGSKNKIVIRQNNLRMAKEFIWCIIRSALLKALGWNWWNLWGMCLAMHKLFFKSCLVIICYHVKKVKCIQS